MYFFKEFDRTTLVSLLSDSKIQTFYWYKYCKLKILF